MAYHDLAAILEALRLTAGIHITPTTMMYLLPAYLLGKNAGQE